MLARIGVLALVGLLGALGSLLITRNSLASGGLTEPSTTTAAASTTVGTTAGTTTAASTSTGPTTPPIGVPITRPLARNCVTVGGVMLLLPGRQALVLNPVADSAHARQRSGPFVYPSSGAFVRVAGVDPGSPRQEVRTDAFDVLVDGTVRQRPEELPASVVEVRLPARHLGTTAASMLLERIGGDTTPPRTVELRAEVKTPSL